LFSKYSTCERYFILLTQLSVIFLLAISKNTPFLERPSPFKKEAWFEKHILFCYLLASFTVQE